MERNEVTKGMLGKTLKEVPSLPLSSPSVKYSLFIRASFFSLPFLYTFDRDLM